MDFISPILETIKKPLPIGVTAELTYRCNLRCIHCYCTNSISKELTLNEWKRAIDILKSWGTVFITFTGGEPLLREDLLQIMRYASKNGMALRLFTNGTLINEKIADHLKDMNLLEVEVSIQGDK